MSLGLSQCGVVFVPTITYESIMLYLHTLD